ncbi:unnamed protein product [Pleuronectes platessa]|uniref:Uncharacterized protein n=1 Tax=Pleuronectes platessa TaxID=8262 RepID=A0A9N7TLN9_PLEPL|nr:unnamed protein product [Pleuronectes platessa]
MQHGPVARTGCVSVPRHNTTEEKRKAEIQRAIDGAAFLRRAAQCGPCLCSAWSTHFGVRALHATCAGGLTTGNKQPLHEPMEMIVYRGFVLRFWVKFPQHPLLCVWPASMVSLSSRTLSLENDLFRDSNNNSMCSLGLGDGACSEERAWLPATAPRQGLVDHAQPQLRERMR